MKILFFFWLCILVSSPAWAAGSNECTGKQLQVTIQSPNPEKFMVKTVTMTLVSYDTKGVRKTVNTRRTVAGNRVDFTIPDPVTSTDSFHLQVLVTCDGEIPLNYEDNLTQQFSPGCDPMHIQWKTSWIQ